MQAKVLVTYLAEVSDQQSCNPLQFRIKLLLNSSLVTGAVLLAGKGIGKGVSKGDGKAVISGFTDAGKSIGNGFGQGVNSTVTGAADGVLSAGQGLVSGVKNIGKGFGSAFLGSKKSAKK